MGQGGCGRRELVVEAARQILRCVYTVRVSVWVYVCVGRRSEEKVCVCGEQNKQNLYSLNRMTLYKFSCAAMGLQVCVCVGVCMNVLV